MDQPAYEGFIYFENDLTPDERVDISNLIIERAHSISLANLHALSISAETSSWGKAQKTKWDRSVHRSHEDRLDSLAKSRTSEEKARDAIFSDGSLYLGMARHLEIKAATEDHYARWRQFLKGGGAGSIDLCQPRRKNSPRHSEQTHVRVKMGFRLPVPRQPWNSLEMYLSGDGITTSHVGVMNSFLVECLQFLCEKKYALFGWTHLDRGDDFLSCLGQVILCGNWRDTNPEYEDLGHRQDTAQKLGWSRRYVPHVFWGNFWGGTYVERLGGTKSVLAATEDCFSHIKFPDGGVFFTLTDDVLDFMEASKDSPFVERKERLLSFLGDYGVLLPPREELEREWEPLRQALLDQQAPVRHESAGSSKKEHVPAVTRKDRAQEGPPSYLEGKTCDPDPEGPASLLLDSTGGHGEPCEVYDIRVGECRAFGVRCTGPEEDIAFPAVIARPADGSEWWFPVYDPRRHPASGWYDPHASASPELAFNRKCSKCSSLSFRLAVAFEVPEDSVDVNDTSWFTLAVQCISCWEKKIVFDDETA